MYFPLPQTESKSEEHDFIKADKYFSVGAISLALAVPSRKASFLSGNNNRAAGVAEVHGTCKLRIRS